VNPEADLRLNLIHRLFAGTGKSYDLMVNFATFGIDRRWKRRIVDLIPPNSVRVLDLACGTGISTLAIATRYPDCHVVGVELREEYLQIARAKIEKLGIRNVEFVLGRAEDYQSHEPFDCITSSYLAKYADLSRLTSNTKKMLKAGGFVLMHDFTYPPKASLIRIWRVYFKVLQLVGTVFFPAWRAMLHGLPALIRETRWLPELRETLREKGFTNIKTEYLTAYGSAIVTAHNQETKEDVDIK
jgi:demethylmenaquinone methyltransferase/2-methoxy-6-polyprenyl-1,4-benzoquinol methylase